MKITLSNNPSFPPTGGQVTKNSPRKPFITFRESVKKERETFYCSNRVFFFIATIVLTITTLQGYAQGMMAPPSPNAQALARYAAVPVNYYTGIPSISIPLYTLPGKELSVPISLSYHAGGNKVQDVASWVGLGWSLNAGGVITRVVRGLPDEDPNGYCGVNNIGEKAGKNLPNNDASWEYLNKVFTGEWDGEPDMFYFNFLGMSGKFVLDASGKAYTIPYQNLKIKVGIGLNGNNEWEIIDGNGTRYVFGKYFSHRETSEVTTTIVSNESATTTTETFVSSWYLSKIDNSNSTSIINFSYSQGLNKIITYKNYRINEVAGAICWAACQQDSLKLDKLQTITTNIKIKSPKYITSISSEFGSINFIKSVGTREDLANDHFLEKVTIKDKYGATLNDFYFDYSYFNSAGCSTSECKRLKLSSINENTEVLANFEYNETQNLPSRLSNKFDHWGFYNANSSSSNLVEVTYNNTIHPGGSREPDASKSLANILTKILYPTGFSQQFNYDNHKYVEGGIERLIGGARILSIINSDSYGNSNVVQYDYKSSINNLSSGQVYSLPYYFELLELRAANCFIYSKYMSRQSSVLNLLFDMGGVHIGYSEVKETSPLSEAIYTFYNFSDYSDNVNTRRRWLAGYVTSSGLQGFYPPYIPNDYYGWKRGLPKEVKLFDTNSNPISVSKYEYNFSPTIKREIIGTKVSFGGLINCPNSNSNLDYFFVKNQGSYSIISQPFYQTKQTTQTYDQTNPTIKTTNVKKFVYNNQSQLSETTAYNLARTSSKQITKIKYVNDPDYSWLATQQCEDDYIICEENADTEAEFDDCDIDYYHCISNLPIADTDVKAILNLRIKHAINVPVEQLSIIEEAGTQYLVGATYAKFKTQGSSSQMVVPFRSYVMDELIPYTAYQTSSINNSGNFIEPIVAGATYKLVGTSNFSTATGQLTYQTGNDGTVASYGYDSKGILNSTSTTNGILITTASQIVTPLVGVAQKTDANGRQVNYTYDKKGRLKYVKDHNNNVVTRYRYNTEAPLTSQIEVDASFIVGEQIDFTALNPFDHGVSAITWGLDDGTVLENSIESISHTFNAAGLYTVSFTVTNPEYKLLTVTKTIAIYNPISITIMFENGDPFTGDNIDICNMPYKKYSNFSVNVTGGSPNKTYVWTYKKDSNNPVVFNPLTGFLIFEGGIYLVKCVVTDEYNNSKEITKAISADDSSCEGTY